MECSSHHKGRFSNLFVFSGLAKPSRIYLALKLRASKSYRYLGARESIMKLLARCSGDSDQRIERQNHLPSHQLWGHKYL